MNKLAGKSQLFHIFYGALCALFILPLEWYTISIFTNFWNVSEPSLVLLSIYAFVIQLVFGYMLSTTVWQAYRYREIIKKEKKNE